jgi:hypothetical protein
LRDGKGGREKNIMNKNNNEKNNCVMEKGGGEKYNEQE